MALLTVPGEHGGPPVTAALVVKDALDESYSLYVVPRDLLLQGPNGEYVMAGDSLAGGTIKQDLQRVIDTKIDHVYELPSDTLARLAATGELQLALDEPRHLEREPAPTAATSRRRRADRRRRHAHGRLRTKRLRLEPHAGDALEGEPGRRGAAVRRRAQGGGSEGDRRLLGG